MAIAQGMREVYATLFEMNEYVYELDNSSLKKLIIEATGAEADSNPVAKTLSTFTALNKIADFETKFSDQQKEIPVPDTVTPNYPIPIDGKTSQNSSEGINLSYTINLNLPTTSDIEVFNAIFKSLKQHLLQE